MSTLTGFTLLKELYVSAFGRNSPLQEQPPIAQGASSPPPSLASDGITLADAVTALAGVRLRKNAASQEVRVTVPSDVADDIYRVTLGGVDFDYDSTGLDAAEAILNGLQAVIEAASAYTASVDTSGAAPVLIIKGVGDGAYSVAVSVPGGTGVLAYTREPGVVHFRVWGLPIANPSGDGANAWFRLPIEGRPDASSSFIVVTDNWIERLGVAAFARLYVQILETDGDVVPLVGPAQA